MKAIYPSSYDPIHNGHIEIIKEAADIYEHVYLLVANNEEKIYQNTLTERGRLVQKCIDDLGFKNVTVISQEPGKLTPEIAREMDIEVIVRGVISQSLSRYEDELADAYLNINDNLSFNYIVSKKFTIDSPDIIKMNKRFESIKGLVPDVIEKDVILGWK